MCQFTYFASLSWRRAIGACLLPIAAAGPRAIAVDLLDREEPSVIVRHFDPVASALDLGVVTGSERSRPQQTQRNSAESVGRSIGLPGGWNAVAVLNWHWRPRALAARVRLPLGTHTLDEREEAAEAGGNTAEFHCFEFWSGAYQRLTARLVPGTHVSTARAAAWAEVEVGLPLVAADTTPASRSLPTKGSRGRGVSALFTWRSKRSSRRIGDGNDDGDIDINDSIGARWREQVMPAHSSSLFLLRPVLQKPDNESLASRWSWPHGLPAFVGSDVHFSSGLEVAAWDHRLMPQHVESSIIVTGAERHTCACDDMRQQIEIRFAVGRAVSKGHVWLYLPPVAADACAEAGEATGDGGANGGDGGGGGGDGSPAVGVERSAAPRKTSPAPAERPLVTGGAFAGSVEPVSDSGPSGSAAGNSGCSTIEGDNGGDNNEDTVASGGGGGGRRACGRAEPRVWKIGVVFGGGGDVLEVQW